MPLDDQLKSSIDATLDDLRGRLDRDFRDLADRLLASLTAARAAEIDEVRQSALADAQADTARQVAEAEARLRAEIDTLVADARTREREQTTAEVRRQVESEAEQKLGEALASMEQRMATALHEADARAEQTVKESVTAAHVQEREAEMAGVSRLLESIRGLDGAATLSEVLDALGLAAGREAARAAVLVLRNERLLGWKLSGFGARDAQPKALDLGLTDCGVIGQAVSAARPIGTHEAAPGTGGPGFADLPSDRLGFAVPVIVGGRVVAVVYADSVEPAGQEPTVPSGWPETIEILARHAARVLEALTVQKTTAAPSPRFWVPPAGRAGTQQTAPAPPDTDGAPPRPGMTEGV